MLWLHVRFVLQTAVQHLRAGLCNQQLFIQNSVARRNISMPEVEDKCTVSIFKNKGFSFFLHKNVAILYFKAYFCVRIIRFAKSAWLAKCSTSLELTCLQKDCMPLLKSATLHAAW